jgi:hypothetical protein
MEYTTNAFIAFIIIACSLSTTSADTGEATVYGGNPWGNACGYNGIPTSSFPYNNYAAVGGDYWKLGYQCGACYQITCTGPGTGDANCGCTSTPTVVVQVADKCSECSTSRPSVIFDLSPSAHDKISTCGMTAIQYYRVDCDYKTNIVVRNKEGTTRWWYGFHVDNVAKRGALSGVEIISKSFQWYDCDFVYENFWLCNGGQPIADDLPYDVKFIADDGSEVLAYDAITSFASSAQFDTGINF